MSKKTDFPRLVSILSYFMVGIFWFLIDNKLKHNPITKFHVKQAINLFIIVLILTGLISRIFIMREFISSAVGLFSFIFWVVGVINAINMNENEIPVIGQLAEKYMKF